MNKALEAVNPANIEVNNKIMQALCAMDVDTILTFLSGTGLSVGSARSRVMNSSYTIFSEDTGNDLYIVAANDFAIFDISDFDNCTLYFNGRKFVPTGKNSDVDFYTLLEKHDREKDRRAKELGQMTPRERQEEKHAQLSKSVAPSISEYKRLHARAEEEKDWRRGKGPALDEEFFKHVERFNREATEMIGAHYDLLARQYRATLFIQERHDDLKGIKYIPKKQIRQNSFKIDFNHLSILEVIDPSHGPISLIALIDYSRLFDRPVYGLAFALSPYGADSYFGDIQTIAKSLDLLLRKEFISMETMITISKFIADASKKYRKESKQTLLENKP